MKIRIRKRPDPKKRLKNDHDMIQIKKRTGGGGSLFVMRKICSY